MNLAARSRELVLFTIVSLGLITMSLPQFAHATQAQADAMCNPVFIQCQCNTVPDPKNPGSCIVGVNWFNCPMYCTDVTNGGTTKGHCDAPTHCHGDTTSGAAGQAGGGLGMQQLMSALQGLLGALQAGAGGGGAAAPAATGSQGCTTFYQTSVQGNPDPCSYYVPTGTNPNSLNFQIPTTSGSTLPGLTCTTFTPTSIVNDPNPCTFYVPAGSTSTNANSCASYTQTSIVNDPTPCTFYVPAANSGSGTGAAVSGSGNSTNTINVFVNAQAQGPTFFSSILNSIVGMGGGGGDIQVKDSGATIYAGSADTHTNSGIAGFFGADATSGQTGGGIITRLCITRPWAGSLLSVLIPPTFFDTLCKLRGYQVGSTPPPPPVVQSPTAVQPTVYIPPPTPVVTTPAQNGNTQVQTVPPQADIWAVPTSVPIGGRTSIFWNSRGVKSCLVTSPDGSFNETSLSGGGSTVPIVATTIFTISCVAMDDSHVTNSVTVYLSI